MIVCRLDHLLARCKERGYTLDEVRPCVVSEDGDSITVDETHAAYPHARPAQAMRIAPTHSRNNYFMSSTSAAEMLKLMPVNTFYSLPYICDN